MCSPSLKSSNWKRTSASAERTRPMFFTFPTAPHASPSMIVVGEVAKPTMVRLAICAFTEELDELAVDEREEDEEEAAAEEGVEEEMLLNEREEEDVFLAFGEPLVPS